MSSAAIEKINWKIITYVSLAMMLVTMLFTSKDFGISGDEITQNTYGQKVFDYYATFGKDQSCFQPFGRITNAFYYGGFYDLLCVTINKVSPFDPFDTRHFINSIFGFLIILTAARFAKFLKNWQAALLVSWLLFLSPRFFGDCMNNPKDVPFALGMLLGIFYIYRFIQAFPKPSLKDKIGLALSIGFAISIRVGGILLLPFLGFGFALVYFSEFRKQYALNSKEVRQYVINCIGLGIAGYLIGLIFWPYGLQNPISNPFTALHEMTQFSTSISMLFNDHKIVSDNVPWYYIPKWIFISSPVIVLLGIIISPILLVNKEYKFSYIFFLFFATLFPLLYIIYQKSPLYDGWRHLFFIYPPLVLLASLAFMTVLKMAKTNAVKYAVIGGLVVGLLLPARYCIANHPNEIVYFNELVGGIDGAYSHYETDYYMNSVKQAAFRLARKYDLFHTKDTVVVASNAIEPVLQYFSRINPKVVCIYIRYYQRYEKKWDFALIYTRFIDKDLLKNENGESYFPPANTIDVVKADNTPLCAIVKADPERLAYKANEFLRTNVLDSAAFYFGKALQKDPKDETSLTNYAMVLCPWVTAVLNGKVKHDAVMPYVQANLNRVGAAIQVMNDKAKMTPNDAQTHQMLMELYLEAGDRNKAQQEANKVQELVEREQE
jgi:tetratricopeptide (TPR) repeat protein